MNTKVLTTGHWPNDQKEAIQSLAQLPRELSNAMTCFTQFYYNKFNNGRQLNWKLSLGSADLKAKFGSGPHRYEFQVSTYQMVLLLLFNQHESLTYSDVQHHTQIPV